MKKITTTLIICLFNFFAWNQCDDNISICTPGQAGPFNFINTPGPPTDYANPVNCLTGTNPALEEFAFIVLNITGNGDLDLLIDGDGGTGSGFLDVVVYNIPPGVAPCNAAMNDANEIGCNYAANDDGCVQFGGAPNINCNSSIVAPVVNTGDQIMIIVHNYGDGFGGSGNSNFTLELGNSPTSASTGPADATINPAGPLLETDAAINMTAVTGGGTWSATCGACIDAVTGEFDPNVAGVGDHDICYTAGSPPCDDNDCYTITVNPDCNTFISSITINGAQNCQITQDITGTVDIVSGFPATGDLIVEDCHGNQDIIASAPFAVGSYNFAITTPADGGACDITAYFSDEVACNDSYAFVADLGSGGNEAGTFNVGHTGDGLNTPVPASNFYVLCDQDEFTFSHNNDFNIGDVSAGTADPTDGYAPGILYFLYSCPPSPGGAGITPWADDPCWVGYINGGDDIILLNDGGTADGLLSGIGGGGPNNTFYIVPITSYDVNGPFIQTDCYDLSINDTYQLQYLNPITFTFSEDCQAGTATITLNGGYPEFYPGEEFTGSNLSHGNFTDNTAEHGQTITISGLNAGDDYSFEVIDQNGCPITINPAGTFPPLFDAAFGYTENSYCTTGMDPNPIGVTNPGGTFYSIQAGLSINAGNGSIDLSNSTDGVYDVVYSTQPLDAVCFDTDTFQVIINATPVVNDVLDAAVCGSYTLPTQLDVENNNNTANIGLFTAPDGGGSQLGFGTPFTTVGTTTIYIYDQTATVPNCFDEESFDVTINLTPTVNDIADAIECDTYTLPSQADVENTNNTANIGLFSATNGGGTQYTFGNAFTTLGTTTVYIYDETGTATNCFDEESFTITINPSVNAGADNNATMCNAAANTSNLSADMLDPMADAGGNWFETTPVPSGQFNPATSVFDASGLADGNYTFIYVVPAVAPCINDTAYFTINVTGTIDAGADHAATYCNDSGTNIDIGSMLDAGVTGGTWSEISVVNSSQFDNVTAMLDASNLSTGTYEFQYDIPGNGPCVGDNAVMTITVNETPQLNDVLDISQCDGYVLPAISGTSLTPGVSYYDQAGGAGNPIAPGTNITSTQTIYIYDETGTTPNCFDEKSFDVTINLTPSIDAIADVTICDGYTLPAITGTNLTAGVSYHTQSGGLGVSMNSGLVLNSSQTVYIYDETGSNPNCLDEKSFDVTINLTPSIDAIADADSCNQYTFPDITGANLTGNEMYFDGPSGTGNSFSPGDVTTNGGLYYIYDETNSTPNCFDEITFNVTINTSITAGQDNATSICMEGGIVDVGALLDPMADAGGTWSETSGSGQFDVANQEFDVQNINSGDYVFHYEVNGVAPCLSDIAIFTVTVHPLPNVFAGNDLTICDGDQVVLTGSGANNLVWDNGVVDGQLFTPPGSTTYTVTGTDLNGCVNTDDVDVNIQLSPNANFTANQTNGCIPLDVEFNLTTPQDPGSTIVWDFGNNTQALNAENVNTIYNNSDCFDVSCTVTSSLGCASTITYQDYICADEVPNAEFTITPGAGTIFDSEINFTNNSTDAMSYNWIFGDQSANSQEENPIHEYPNDVPGTYNIWLIAYGNNPSCLDSTTMSVEILDQLLYHIPNTFTPDGDDYNESFKPVFYSGFDPYNYTLLIFDRWGETLFESHDTSVGWDGKYGGKIVKDGTYLWKIEFKETMSDKRHSIQGHVNVLR